MKIRLLTFHFSDNFGASLQAWGLRKWLKDQNYDAEFINYEPSYVENGGNLNYKLSFKGNLTILYLRFKTFYQYIFGNKSQKKEFTEFRSLHLNIKSKKFRKNNHIKIDSNTDILICGSDQIWNPSDQYGLDKTYFLSFPGSNEIKKISYAPSFGSSSIPKKYHKELIKRLNSFDHISIRERNGKSFLNSLGFKNVTCVPDPTILCSNFDSLIHSSKSEDKYTNYENILFCYALRSDKGIREVAERISKNKKLKILSPVSSFQLWKPIGSKISPGPIDWLKLMYKSKYVVTNSFHGVAFSIILRKDFLVIPLAGKKSPLNERKFNLLNYFGLQDRIISSFSNDSIDKKTDQKIDWINVNNKLNELKLVGEEYLKSSIKNCEG